MVNNAATEVPGDIELCLVDHFRLTQDVNLNGMIAVTKAVLPMIRKTKGMSVAYYFGIQALGGGLRGGLGTKLALNSSLRTVTTGISPVTYVFSYKTSFMQKSKAG